MLAGVLTGAMVVLNSSLNAIHCRAGAGLEDGGQLVTQLQVADGVVGELRSGMRLEQVGATHAFAEVLPELPLAGHEQDVAVGRLVELVANALLHAGRARGPAHVVVGLVAGDLGLRTLVGLEALAAVPVEGGGGVALGDLHPGPLAGLAGPDDAGQHPQGAVERAGVDADGDVLGEVAVAVVVVLGGDDAGPGVVGHAVAGQLAVRPGHAVARDGAEHDGRVDLAELVEPQPEAFQRAGTHGLDHGVGAGGQLQEGGDALVGLEVQHDAALAPVEVQVHQRHALDDGPGHLADVVARRRLDLDDLGPQVDQRRGDGGRVRAGRLRGCARRPAARREDGRARWGRSSCP